MNDAPSLKKSDCGIAVEGASEAAQVSGAPLMRNRKGRLTRKRKGRS